MDKFERRRLRVYLAGPMYSAGDPFENVQHALTVARRMVDDGLAPYVPQLTAYLYLGGSDWNVALEWDLEWVASSEAIYRLPGYSRGADLEVRAARDLSIPVFYENAGEYLELIDFARSRHLVGKRR